MGNVRDRADQVPLAAQLHRPVVQPAVAPQRGGVVGAREREGQQVEVEADRLVRHHRHRAGEHIGAERVEQQQAGAQVLRRQQGESLARERFGGGGGQEQAHPGLGLRPEPGPLQEPGEGVHPVRVLARRLVGEGRVGRDAAQAANQLRPVRRGGAVVVDDALHLVAPAGPVRVARHVADLEVEPPLQHHLLLVREVGAQVVVEQVEDERPLPGPHQAQGGADDEPGLPAATEHGLEQLAVGARRGGHQLAGTGDDVHRLDRVHLEAVALHTAADAADAQRAAHRQVQVVRQAGRHPALRECGVRQLRPGDARLHDGAAGGDPDDPVQSAGVDRHAAAHAGLAVAGVRLQLRRVAGAALAVHRDRDAVAAGEADQGGDVAYRARPQHGARGGGHQVSEVPAEPGQGGGVGHQGAVQVRQPRECVGAGSGVGGVGGVGLEVGGLRVGGLHGPGAAHRVPSDDGGRRTDDHAAAGQS